ncbi:class I SAM-dependent methyltransferase [Microbispora sp. CA-102843]|uniref:class I SAM-dependent methyltransferase n=1 Tax=Microbispora sp. CA-102843 TaxID=3239952 RepID=UPI003D8B7899
MDTVSRHYDQLLARHYTWMLGGDLTALVAEQTRLLRDLGVEPRGPGETAVDLGCGPGNQTLALAALGYGTVFAVDTSKALLDELASHAEGNQAIRPVHADIRGVLPAIAEPASAAAIVCMGDTLTHLPRKADVTALLADCAAALAQDGRLVVTYRDLTRPLHGADRFVPVRSTPDQVLTCFLEYVDEETVMVHDVLHRRSGATWTQQVGSYPKLRIGADWLAGQCAAAGLTLERDETGPRGMRLLAAVKKGRPPIATDAGRRR